jgi:hypothetical protein
MRATLLHVAFALVACSSKESGSPPASGSAAPAGSAAAAGSSAPAIDAPPAAQPIDAAPAEDDATTVAKLVVDAVASNAFGKQTIDASCVSVTIVPSGDSTVAAARLKDCGDKTARSMVWVFTRTQSARTWTEAFLGTPPKCWKGIPPEIKQAVAVATKIRNC